ncbi:GNAT family N-acetyltransferase [Myxococcota bacterium]|nr:GNAT family N-acetyltransferase [Myxococcota bacterium]
MGTRTKHAEGRTDRDQSPRGPSPGTESVDVRIRTARADDLEVLVGFNLAMARETEALELDRATVRSGVAALLSHPDRGRVLMVEEAGVAVAALALTLEWSDWRNGMFWWIQSVYVHPDHRRRGHYRRLHEHVRGLAAADPEVCGLRLYVEHENRGAQATYRSLGMRETAYRLYEQGTRGSA